MFTSQKVNPITHIWTYILIVLFMGFGTVGPMLAQNQPATSLEDSSSIQTLEQFRQAITSGDRVSAGKLLAKDAIIMQIGERITREEFVNKHIIPECDYIYSVNQSVDKRIIRQIGPVTWICSTYLVEITHEEDSSKIERKLAELAILRQRENEWKIDMIHWSNCPTSSQ